MCVCVCVCTNHKGYVKVYGATAQACVVVRSSTSSTLPSSSTLSHSSSSLLTPDRQICVCRHPILPFFPPSHPPTDLHTCLHAMPRTEDLWVMLHTHCVAVACEFVVLCAYDVHTYIAPPHLTLNTDPEQSKTTSHRHI